MLHYFEIDIYLKGKESEGSSGRHYIKEGKDKKIFSPV
jgi:hypothetical protein